MKRSRRKTLFRQMKAEGIRLLPVEDQYSKFHGEDCFYFERKAPNQHGGVQESFVYNSIVGALVAFERHQIAWVR